MYQSDDVDCKDEAAPKKKRGPAKPWRFLDKHSNAIEAKEFVNAEDTWYLKFKHKTEAGEKWFYGCNKVKRRGPQCAAEIYLLCVSNSDEVFVYRKDAEHNHDEIGTQGNRGIEESTKIEINNLLDLGFKSKAILAELEKIDGIVVPTKLQLNNYIAVRRRCTLETSVISSGPVPESNRKQKVPVLHSDKVPMYCSNESESEEEITPKKTRVPIKPLASLNKRSNVKEAEYRTKCKSKDKVPLYHSDGSESKGEMAPKKLRGPGKVWVFKHRFSNVKEAEEFMISEDTWSLIIKKRTKDGEKMFYRCNKVKRKGPQCAAELYLLFVSDSDEVFVYCKDAEHNHDEIETQGNRGNRGIEEWTKIEINKLLDLHLKPRAILAHLEKIEGIVLPTKTQLARYIAERRRRSGTSVNYSGSTRVSNKKYEGPVNYSVGSDDEVALTNDQGPNQLCDTVKCKVEDEVAPNKEVLNRCLKDAQCRQSPEFNSEDEAPYCSNESESEDEVAPKKKRVPNKPLASRNKCLNVKYRTKCKNKDEVSLYRSDGSKFEGKMAPKKMRGPAKVLLFEDRFSNAKEAEEFINSEDTWSQINRKRKEDGEKWFYRCNKVKRRGPQCAAELYLLLVRDSDEVMVYRRDAEHNHDEIETEGNRGIEESTKIEINNMLDLGFKVKGILAELEKIDGIVVPTKTQLYNYISVRRRLASGTFVALTNDQGPNQLCNTLKCQIKDKAAVSLFSNSSDKSEYDVMPIKQAPNQRVKEAECIQRPECNSADEIPMYFSNESKMEEDIASTEKIRPSKTLASQNNCLTVKKPDDTTKCRVKELNHSYGSESEDDKVKVWLFENRFSNINEAEDFINAEDTWSQIYKKITGDGEKLFYRCNKVKKRGPQCAAELYLLFVSDSDEVFVHRKDAEHNHDEIGTQENRDIEESTKIEINNLLDKHLKPRSILAHLENMDGIVLPTKTQLNNCKAERKRRTFDTSVIYSGPTTECDSKEEVPEYEVALTDTLGPNQLCDTLKCNIEDEAAVSSLCDESEYGVIPNKQALNKLVREAECRQSPECISADETPMYYSNESETEDDVAPMAPKKKRGPNEALSSLNKCSSVKESKYRTRRKDKVPLYNYDSSESESEMAPRKMRGPAKAWVFKKPFSNFKKAEEFMNDEDTWSLRYKKITGDGEKWFYRCNKVKRRGPQCVAELYLLFVRDSDEVLVYRKDAEHNHDEIGAQRNYGIKVSTKIVINDLLDLRLKPRAILAHLEKMEGIVLPTKKQLNNYLAERRRCSYGTSVIYSESMDGAEGMDSEARDPEPEEQVECIACSDLIQPDAAMYRCVECAAATLCGRCLSAGHDRHCLMRLPSTRVYRVLEDLFQQLRLEVCGRLGKDGDDLVEESHDSRIFPPDAVIKAETTEAEDFEPQLEPDPLATDICRRTETECKVDVKPVDNTLPVTLKPKLKRSNIKSERQNVKQSGRQRIEDSRQRVQGFSRRRMEDSGRKSVKNNGRPRIGDKRETFEGGG